MSAEGMQTRRDITDVIRTLGEPLTFSRGGRVMAKVKGSFDKIDMRNIDLGSASPMASEARVVTVEYTGKYEPQLYDVCQDSHNHIFNVINVQSVRFEDTLICYTLTVT